MHKNIDTHLRESPMMMPMHSNPHLQTTPVFYNDESESKKNKDSQSKCDCGDICCKKVESHISNCNICKKVYSDDKTVYIVIIVVLLIIIAILAKKVFRRLI